MLCVVVSMCLCQCLGVYLFVAIPPRIFIGFPLALGLHVLPFTDAEWMNQCNMRVGQLGDFGLVSALRCLASKPSLIQELFCTQLFKGKVTLCILPK